MATNSTSQVHGCVGFGGSDNFGHSPLDPLAGSRAESRLPTNVPPIFLEQWQ
jgi:hypothetical protein